MEIQSKIIQSWNDWRLKWQPDDYEGIRSIYIPSSEIWTPTLFLNDTHFDKDLASCHPINCLVEYDSKVSCSFPCHQSISCKGSSRDWPFDVQNCSFIFVIGNNDLEFNTDQVTAKMLSDSSNYWTMVEAKVKAALNTNYVNYLKFNFKMQRMYVTALKRVIIPGYTLIALTLTILLTKEGSFKRSLLSGVSIYLHFELMDHTWWL